MPGRAAVEAAQTGHRIAFAAAVDWVARLRAAHNAGRLPAELVKLRRIDLLVVDAARRICSCSTMLRPHDCRGLVHE